MRKLHLFSVFGEFQAPPIGLKSELQHVEFFTKFRLDADILETILRKTGEKSLFWYMWLRD